MKTFFSLLLLLCLVSCSQPQSQPHPRYAPATSATPPPAALRAETNAPANAAETPKQLAEAVPVPASPPADEGAIAHPVIAQGSIMPPEPSQTYLTPPAPSQSSLPQAASQKSLTPAAAKPGVFRTNAPSPFAHPPQPAIPANAHPLATSATPGAETAAAKAEPEPLLPAHSINFEGVPVDKVLEVYAMYVGRTLLRSPAIPAATMVTLVQETPLTRTEIIHALDAELAMNNIAMIPIGEKFIKVVPLAEAGAQGDKIDELNASYLAEFGPYDTRIVQLKYIKPSDVVPILQQFTKTPSAITPVENAGMLVLRDSAENMRIMLQVIALLDTSVPTEIESAVIPIKYALATDIANALNSLSGSGGTASSSRGISRSPGLGSRTGTTGSSFGGSGFGGTTSQGSMSPGGLGGVGGGSTLGSSGGSASSSFTDRVRNLVQQASSTGGAGGKGAFQILGETKIIADERMNALLVFATHQDMVTIKNLIKQLDVVLPQVLIEAIIMEVTIDNTKSLGVSAAQQPMGNNIATAGGYNNGQNYFPFLPSESSGSNAFPGNFTSTLPANMFSYWGNFNGNFDLAVQAAENDSRVNVLSTPRIQTSHGVEADLFVGETIPYVDSTTAGAFGGTGVYNSYQQQQIGITLKIKPLINPDGLVVMDIYAEASEPGPSSTAVDINGTSVPTINQRDASATVAVKDRDTVILGGMISTTDTKTISGVPYIMNIPLLGKLFQSSSDQKERTELIILMRPTVLPTPEAAATVAAAVRKSMAGVRRAEAEIRADESTSMKQAEDEIKHLTNGVPPPDY